MKHINLLMFLTLILAGCTKDPIPDPISGSFEDARDNHSYKWIRIGEQVWMAENLAYLPDVSPASIFSVTEPLYYVYGYEGGSVSEAHAHPNFTQHGVLYNWEAAQKACPADWHPATDEEWKVLEKYLGMNELQAESEGFRESGSVGQKLKSTLLWEHNGAGDNTSGFNAYPSGYRSYSGNYEGAGQGAGFWSSTEEGSLTAWYRGLVFASSGVQRFYYSRTDAFSVRCLRDQ